MKSTFNPALEAARAKAQELAAAAVPVATWPPVRPRAGRAARRDIADIKTAAVAPKVERVQFLVRLTPAAQERIRFAAAQELQSLQDYVEAWALTLPERPKK